MRLCAIVIGLGLSAASAVAFAQTATGAAISPGTYSNEEQVYFATEAGSAVPPRLFVRIDADKSVMQVDAFDRELSVIPAGTELTAKDGAIDVRLADGQKLDMRRARPATCWVAIRKDRAKADGSEDWLFERNVRLHDQGGRALVGGAESGAQPVVIRMRNVVWPPAKDGSSAVNKPSIVLYVHKPDQPDRAESYVWADPGAARIGINLRWMQASCAIDGLEKPASATP